MLSFMISALLACIILPISSLQINHRANIYPRCKRDVIGSHFVSRNALVSTKSDINPLWESISVKKNKFLKSTIEFSRSNWLVVSEIRLSSYIFYRPIT